MFAQVYVLLIEHTLICMIQYSLINYRSCDAKPYVFKALRLPGIIKCCHGNVCHIYE